MFSGDKCAWISRRFNQISISMDGPPDVHNRNRPGKTGWNSAEIVERNILTLIHEGSRPAVRCTVVPQDFERLPNLIAYISQLGVKTISVEPAYRHQPADCTVSAAASFVRHFLLAKDEAAKISCEVQTSCCRLHELHGPYCDILRNTLLVSPDGVCYPCTFCATDRSHQSYAIGQALEQQPSIELDYEKLFSFYKEAAAIPDGCSACLSAYHCARNCPDVCYIADSGSTNVSSFRCQVARRLGVEYVLRLAHLAESEQANSSVFRHDFAEGDRSCGPVLAAINKAYMQE
jgi:uncharacterized protein